MAVTVNELTCSCFMDEAASARTVGVEKRSVFLADELSAVLTSALRHTAAECKYSAAANENVPSHQPK